MFDLMDAFIAMVIPRNDWLNHMVKHTILYVLKTFQCDFQNIYNILHSHWQHTRIPVALYHLQDKGWVDF